MTRRLFALAAAALAAAGLTSAQQPNTDPSLQPLLDKVAQYVASYGEKASMFVGVETYTQSVTLAAMNPDAPPLRPYRITAEFAIVKVPGEVGWIGYRDVVEYNGQKVSDRRDRLVSILTDPSADASLVTQLANESARYNVGPVSRNFNTPTSALFFFHRPNLQRFVFTKRDTKKIDGTETWEIAFKETSRPTIVRTRSGVDVPLEGSLWVVPADGAVVRSRLVMRNFADEVAPPSVQGGPGGKIAASPRPGSPLVSAGLEAQRIDSLADIDVTYSRHQQLGVWLPARMTENYAGAMVIQKGKPRQQGTAITRATYSDFKRFGADVKINLPK